MLNKHVKNFKKFIKIKKIQILFKLYNYKLLIINYKYFILFNLFNYNT